MKKILIAMLFLLWQTPIACAGMLGDLVNVVGDVVTQAQDATKAKEMARVKLPLRAIQKKDKRIKKIETLAVNVAIKHRWKLQVACPSGKHCTKLKESVNTEAWRIARSMVGSDYAANAKLPEIEFVKSKRYEIALMRKGL